MTDKMATETVYGTNEESHVMSEKVQSLAATVYKEFEKVIKRYDEDVVKDLMPLVVGILESLDAAFTEKQELDVEIELLREDNEQLLTQYEREKQLRKGAEQKFLEMEDNIEGVKKELVDKVETLESIIRMSEIKSKNTADHVTRLEEKEQEQKNEYNKLHERYTELFRTHMDYMERTKILMGTDKLSDLTGMTARANKGLNLPGLRPISVAYGGIMEFHNRHESSPMSFDTGTPHSAANVSLKSELDAQTPKKIESLDKEQLTDSINVTEQATATKHSKQVVLVSPASISEPKPSHTQDTEGYVESVIDTNSTSHVLKANESNIESPLPVIMRRHKSELEEDNSFDYTLSLEDYHMSELNLTLAEIVATTPELEESQDIIASQGTLSKRKSGRNDNSIFDEFSEQDANIAEVDFGADITGRAVNPGEYASSDSDEHEENEEEKEDEENDKDSVGDNFFGIGKELENLISENSELLATKNALNIVKDDLIAKVDELSSEQEILREEINSLQAVKGRLQLRIAQLEEELKKVREENDKRDKEHTEKGEEEDDVPMAQRKRFTRVEMARVLMERNQYKERLMELQEAVRWTEMIRASREHPGELQTKKKSSVWNFFSELVAPSQNAPVAASAVQIPARHQSVIQAVLNPSLHPSHPSTHHWSQDPDSVVPSISLLPSPSQSSLSLNHVTLLPPPDTPTLPSSNPVSVPVILSNALPNLPPTPSGCPPPSYYPDLTSFNAVKPITLKQATVPPKPHRPTSTLPGIHPVPEAPVRHL